MALVCNCFLECLSEYVYKISKKKIVCKNCDAYFALFHIQSFLCAYVTLDHYDSKIYYKLINICV